MDVRFYVDPETGHAHIERHRVSEQEVEDVLENPLEDRPGRGGARVAYGTTSSGRLLRVIYVHDPWDDSKFVITAYPPRLGSATALRRRLKKKGALR